MKLNWSFFINTALSTTLLTSVTLSAQAKEITNYVPAQSSRSQAQVIASLAVDPYQEEHSGKSWDQGFISQRTTEIEFAFALLVLIVGLIASDRYQKNQEKQQIALGESNGNHSVSMEEESEY